jgi:hypothetical protein
LIGLRPPLSIDFYRGIVYHPIPNVIGRTVRVIRRTIILWIIMLLNTPELARALPQLAAQFGPEIHEMHLHDELLMTMDCRACHINPTGGGMRNAHGREFSIEQLPLQGKTGDMEKAIEAAQINRYLSIGTDLRFAYLRAEHESASAYKDSFFPMQADLYVAFTPTDYLTIYYQDGVERSQSRETFVLFQRLPFNSHVKAGRFIPPYGLKLDDHTAFIREKLGFGAPDFGQDAGAEIGFGERHWFGNAAVFNGRSSDQIHRKGFSATAGWKSPLFWLAGSYFNNKTGPAEHAYAGVYGAFHIGRVTLLGEWDQITKDNITEVTGSAIYGELDWRILRGVVAKVKYDGFDPDLDISDDELDRYTIGLDLYPYPFTELLLQYRINTEDPEADNDQVIVMLHVFY